MQKGSENHQLRTGFFVRLTVLSAVTRRDVMVLKVDDRCQNHWRYQKHLQMVCSTSYLIWMKVLLLLQQQVSAQYQAPWSLGRALGQSQHGLCRYVWRISVMKCAITVRWYRMYFSWMVLCMLVRLLFFCLLWKCSFFCVFNVNYCVL